MSTKNSNISLTTKGVMDVWPTSFFINIKRSTYIKRLTTYLRFLYKTVYQYQTPDGISYHGRPQGIAPTEFYRWYFPTIMHYELRIMNYKLNRFKTLSKYTIHTPK
jgi:hypothetical protein